MRKTIIFKNAEQAKKAVKLLKSYGIDSDYGAKNRRGHWFVTFEDGGFMQVIFVKEMIDDAIAKLEMKLSRNEKEQRALNALVEFQDSILDFSNNEDMDLVEVLVQLLTSEEL